MSKRLTITVVLLLIGVFTPGLKNINAQSICISSENFKIKMYEKLKQKLTRKEFDVSEVEKKLVKRIEDHFIKNRVPVKSCNENYDFELIGTVDVQDFMEGTRSLLPVFSSDSIRIVPSKFKKFLPTMTFKNISGKGNPKWKSSHSTNPLDAVRNGLDCFLEQMEEKGVFDFHKHALIRNAISLNKKKLEELNKQAAKANLLAHMIKEAKDEMKKTFKAELQAGLSGLAVQIKKEYRQGLKTLLNRMNQLENRVKNQKSIDKKDIEDFKALVGQFNTKVDAIREDYKLVNYIIVYVDPPADIPPVFQKTYIKPKTCDNCSETEIKANNITKMTRPEDIALLDQNADYGYPLEFGEKQGVKMFNNNDIITIELSEESYNKIFELDSDSDYQILDSIRDRKIDYPRLFVMDRKHRK